MNNRIQHSRRLTDRLSALGAGLLLILLLSDIVHAAAPPLPARFYGAATLNSANTPDAAQITAFVNGVPYAQTATFVEAGNSVYFVDVPADDPETTGAVEGAVEGDTVTFQVEGYYATQTALWTSGALILVDLNAVPPPLAPAAVSQNVTTDEDAPLAITLAATDPNADPLTFTTFSTPTHGTLSGAAPNLTYTPDPDYNGADSFTFQANDGQFDSNVATVSITVNPVPDPPRLAPIGDVTLDENQVLSVPVSASDPDGDAVDLGANGLPAFAHFFDNNDGTGVLELAPTFDDGGVYPGVEILATDGTFFDIEYIVIRVNEIIPQPVAQFSAPKAMNVVLAEDGANVVDASSVSGSFSPANIISEATNSFWRTGSGQVTDQWAKFRLTGERVHVINRVRLRGGSIFNNGLKDFEIRVSTTGFDDADFTTIFSGTVPQDAAHHEFTFAPMQARYVQLYILNNWGNTGSIQVANFEIWTRGREGGLVSLVAGSPAGIADFSSSGNEFLGYGPEKAIDDDPASIWQSGNRANTDQWLKVQLGGGRLYTIDRVRLQSSHATAAINDFEIRVSTTTADDSAFSTVFSGSAASTTDLQTFGFTPVQARYVQLYAVNNHGFFCCVQVNTFQVLTPADANVARLEGVGPAFVLETSSRAPGLFAPERAVDFDATTHWKTASGHVTDQWFKVHLSGSTPTLIDRILLQGPNSSESPQDFEIRASTNSTAGADFTTIFTGTLPQDGRAHWFTFDAVLATYLQLFVRNNHGSTSFIRVNHFQAYSPQSGGTLVPFDDLTSMPAGTITEWAWSFGDGATATERHPVHSYGAAGLYPVQLMVTSDQGVTATAGFDYTVLPVPDVDFTWTPASPAEAQTLYLTGTTGSDDDRIIEWSWQFPDAADQLGRTTNLALPDSGDTLVSLTILDNQLRTNTVTKTIPVLNVAPVVDIGGDRTLLWGEEFQFDATLSDASSVDNATLTCLWDFGDGATQTVANCNSTNADLFHSYATPGIYTPTLTVTDKDGGAASDNLVATVNKRSAYLDLRVVRVAVGSDAEVEAVLHEDPFDATAVLPGKEIIFALDSQTSASPTDTNGLASASFPVTSSAVTTLTAAFAGDVYYFPASDIEVLGADLVAIGVDRSAMDTDLQALTVTGQVDVGIENGGNLETASPFTIVVFEDLDRDGLFTHAADNILGRAEQVSILNADEIVTQSIPVSGVVRFRDNLVYAFIDADGSVDEFDEDNNLYNTGQACEAQVQPGVYAPEIEWFWRDDGVRGGTESLGPYMTPVVAPLVDTNDDGLVDTEDIPAIVFIDGVQQLVAIHGDGSGLIFRITDASLLVGNGESTSQIAVGDIDNDNLPEIITVPAAGGRMIAFENDGTFKWLSDETPAWNPPYTGISWYGGPALADLDHDGTPEIIAGNSVLDSDGSLRWSSSVGGKGSNGAICCLSTVADIDLDGSPEIVTGGTLYRADGTIVWGSSAAINDGYPAVGNFDSDPFAEIAVAQGGYIYLREHTGALKWQSPPNLGSGPPAIGDVDGDGAPEVAVASRTKLSVVETDGTLKWSVTIDDSSSGITGPIIFDLDGDGQGEVIHNDQLFLRIFRGSDGALLFEDKNSSGTLLENPVVADVDRDGNAEIVVVRNNLGHYGTQSGLTEFGISVYGDSLDNWIDSRQIWNQHTYHITNINEDGTVPAYEENHWERYNSFRSNVETALPILSSPDLTASRILLQGPGPGYAIDLTVRIGNGGPLFALAGVPVAVYAGDPATGGILLGTTQTTQDLEPGEYEDVSFSGALPGPGDYETFVVADDDGTGAGAHSECSEDNNAHSQPISAPGLPDLVVQVSDGMVLAQAGQLLTYTITVSNSGPVDALSVALTSTLPAQTGFVDASSGGVYAGDHGIVTWPLFSLTAGNRTTRTVTAQLSTALPSGMDAITHVVTAADTAVDGPDVQPADNVATDTTLVAAAPDLQLTLTGDGEPVRPGDLISYTLVYSNVGTQDATGVVLSDTIPAGAGFDAAGSAAGWSCTVDECIYAVGDLAAGAQGVVSFTLRVDDPLAPEITELVNLATVTDDGSNGPDGDLNDNSASFVTTVAPPNQPPVAQDDGYAIEEDSGLHLLDVLTNDTDPDDDAMLLSAVGVPLHGTASISDALIAYTPTLNFHGDDIFTYWVSDGSVTSTATVSVTVLPVNDPPLAADDAANTDEDVAVLIEALANDVDVDGDALAIVSILPPLHGSAALSGTLIVYTPTLDYSGADSFTYVVSDGALTSTATVEVTINVVDDAPRPAPDTTTTLEDGPVLIDVLANDLEVDGQTLTIIALGQPLSGTTAISGTLIVYTPTLNFHGTDTFTYTVSDGLLDETSTVQVAVEEVNDPPQLVDVQIEPAVIDESGVISLTGQIVDPDGTDTHTVTIDWGDGSVSTLSLGAGIAEFFVTHQYADDGNAGASSGEYLITVVIDDQVGAAATGDLLVTVINVAPTVTLSGPTAVDEHLSATYSISVTDVGADHFTVESQSCGSNATLSDPTFDSASGAGNFVCTFGPGPSTTEVSVSVQDDDSGVGSDSFTVTIVNVNDPPQANDDTATTDEDTPVFVGVLANDSDPDGDSLTIVETTAPVSGTLLFTETGIVYTPTLNFNGTVTVTYAISDGALVDSALVTITVLPVNDPPTANAGGNVDANEGQSLDFDGTGSTDPDIGDTLTYSWDFGDGATATGATPSHTFADNGDFTVCLTVEDSGALTDTACITATISNVAPSVTLTGPATVDEEASENYTVSVDDPGADTFALNSQSCGSNASLSDSIFDSASGAGSFVCTFGLGPSTTEVTITVQDDDGSSGSDSILVGINIVNDPPQAIDDMATTDEDIPVLIDVLANDSDPEGDNLSLVVAGPAVSGTLLFTETGIIYTPTLNFNGSDSFRYVVSDGVLTDTAWVTVTILPVNDDPQADAGSDVSGHEGEPIPFDGSGSTDPDVGDALTYTWDFGDGATDTGATPSHTFADNGLFTVCLTVADSGALTDGACVAATISNVAPSITSVTGPTEAVDIAGQPITLEVTYSDPGTDDSHEVSWAWGDGSSNTTASVNSPVSHSHSYTQAGVYTVTVTVTDDDAGVDSEVYEISVVDTPIIDLNINASDISFDPPNPEPAQTVTLTAAVRNLGAATATDIQVDFRDTSGLLEQVTIPVLAAGATTQVQIQTSFAEAGLRLISVIADPGDQIVEPNEENNEASKVLQVGDPDPSQAVMVIQASSPTVCQGAGTSISGHAYYDFAEIPGENDHPVRGGSVTVTLLDPDTNSPIAHYAGAHTNVNGHYSQAIIAPSGDGIYPARVRITDQTISEEVTTTLTVDGSCPEPPPAPPPPPPPPGEDPDPGTPPPSSPPNTSPPAVFGDVYVRAEDIHFSHENPDPGQSIDLFAFLHYYGVEPVFDVPVTLYDIFPVNGVLTKLVIGTARVSYPNGGNSSPVAVTVSWTANPEGAHVIQVVTEPPFEQFTQNDKATRLLIVGDVPLLSLAKSVTLLIDLDGDGLPSPGDTLQYTLEYANNGSGEATNAVILDDYNETFLTNLTQISAGGVEADGVISWNLGALAAGATGSVSYQVDIIGSGEFPSGLTTIGNIALLTADDTPAVAAFAAIDVAVNTPPIADAGEDQSGSEGANITFDGSGSTDFDAGDSLTYTWDFGDGATATGATPSHIFADNGDFTVCLTVEDNGSLTDTACITAAISNVVPTVTVSGPTNAVEGESHTYTAEVSDPGTDDTHSVLWNCGEDGLFDDGTGLSATCTIPTGVPDVTITAQATDDDGGAGEDSLLVTVSALNQAPAAVDDTATTGEDTSIFIDVLANDSDPDGDGLVIADAGPVVTGTLLFTDTGVVYTPTLNFNGTVTFAYIISDGALTDSALVTVTVLPVNDAPKASGDITTIDEDMPVTIEVLINDSDLDGDSLLIDAVTPPANGAVLIVEATIVYTPALNYYGDDIFTYVVSDSVLTDTATVSVTVAPVNDDPLPLDDEVITERDTSITIDVLANDSDIEDELLTVIGITAPVSGTAVLNEDNTVTYTPTQGFVGVDSLTYTVEDGAGGAATAAIVIAVELPAIVYCELYPIALPQSALAGINPGDAIVDIFNGDQPGNFGWLTWSGNPNVPTLVANLTPPGNLHTYVNPHDQADHLITLDDWVQGKPGVSNSKKVRAALDALLGVEIIVPVWDETEGQGNNADYRVSDFARVHITDYNLSGQNRISAEFLGYEFCGETDAYTSSLQRGEASDSLFIPLLTTGIEDAYSQDVKPVYQLVLPLVYR